MSKTLKKKIQELNPWFCPVSIDGCTVTPGIGSNWSAKKLTNRILYRKKLLLDEVVKRYSFKGKRILDLACNCGYWSSLYVAYGGATFVLGIEGREKVYQQALLYWKNNKFATPNEYKFICGDIMSDQIWKAIRKYEKFDVVLCAGILYHIPNYKKLLDYINSVVNEIIVIDTRVGEKGEKSIKEPGDYHFNAIEATRTKTIPYLPALLQHLKKNNFNCEILPVTFKSPEGLQGPDDYNKKHRVTILAKRVS